MRYRLFQLVWEPDREGHIARHGVTRDEVEEVVVSAPYITRGAKGTRRIIGQTDAGRYLTIIVGVRSRNTFGLITARDATQPERREYWRSRRRQ